MILPVLALPATNSQVTHFEIKTSFSRPSGASKVLLLHTHLFQMCLYIPGMCGYVCIYLLIAPYKVIYLGHCLHASIMIVLLSFEVKKAADQSLWGQQDPWVN